VFAVQTGMITFPILDFLSLIGESGRPDLVPVEVASGIRDMALEALSFHDPQWKDGPLEDEGHYVGRDQEERFEDKPLPANRQSAMGRAQWAAYKITGDQDYRRRAVAIGRYLKRRLFVARDGACYWNFVLPKEPIRGVFPRERIKGEDISHGALSVSLPLPLHSGGGGVHGPGYGSDGQDGDARVRPARGWSSLRGHHRLPSVRSLLCLSRHPVDRVLQVRSGRAAADLGVSPLVREAAGSVRSGHADHVC